MGTRAEIITRVENLIMDDNAEVVVEIPNFLDTVQRQAEDTRSLQCFEYVVEHTPTYDVSYTGGQGMSARWAVPDAGDTDWNGIHRNPVVDNNDGTYTEMEEITLDRFFQLGHDNPADLGKPKYWYLQNSSVDPYALQICYYPEPDDEGPWGASTPFNYKIIVPYWRRLEPLALSADTNWLSDNAEDFMLWATVTLAFEYNEDWEKASLYRSKAAAEWKRIQKVETRGRFNRQFSIFPNRAGRIASEPWYQSRRIRTDWPPTAP